MTGLKGTSHAHPHPSHVPANVSLPSSRTFPEGAHPGSVGARPGRAKPPRPPCPRSPCPRSGREAPRPPRPPPRRRWRKSPASPGGEPGGSGGWPRPRPRPRPRPSSASASAPLASTLVSILSSLIAQGRRASDCRRRKRAKRDSRDQRPTGCLSTDLPSGTRSVLPVLLHAPAVVSAKPDMSSSTYDSGPLVTLD